MISFLRSLFRPGAQKQVSDREAERRAQVQQVQTRLQVVRDQLAMLERRKQSRVS